MKLLPALTILFALSIAFISWLKIPRTTRYPIKFKTLTSTIKSDTSGTIEAIIWNGEREQTIYIDCTLRDKLFQFTGKVYPNDRNVTLFYSGQIPIK